MFSNPPRYDEYLRVRYYIGREKGSRPTRMATELVMPAGREDQLRLFRAYRHSYEDKAYSIALERFYANRPAHLIAPNTRSQDLPDDLAPIGRYYARRFAARALTARERILRVEVWRGSALTPPPGQAADKAARLARQAALLEYLPGSRGRPYSTCRGFLRTTRSTTTATSSGCSNTSRSRHEHGQSRHAGGQVAPLLVSRNPATHLRRSANRVRHPVPAGSAGSHTDLDVLGSGRDHAAARRRFLWIPIVGGGIRLRPGRGSSSLHRLSAGLSGYDRRDWRARGRDRVVAGERLANRVERAAALSRASGANRRAVLACVGGLWAGH